MADTLEKSSPLAASHARFAAASAGGAVTIAELPFLTQIVLRGDAGDAGFQAAIRSVTGCEVPVTANTVAAVADCSALWLGPDEWLIIGPAAEERRLADGIRAALGPRHASMVDVSASRAVIELGGVKAREVLMKGCGLDLHPRAFGPGQCAQTILARAQIILWQSEAAPRYRILVRNSFAPYLAAWLLDAMAEFSTGGAEQR